MSMNDYSNPEQPAKEPLTAKITKFVGIGSSVIIIAGLAYWLYGLGSRDASTVPVISALEGEIRTTPEDAGGEAVDYQGNQVNGVLEGNPPALTDDVELAPRPANLDGVEPAISNTSTTTVQIPVETASHTGHDDAVVFDANIESVAAPERRPELLYIPPKDQMNPLTIEARPSGSQNGEALPVAVTSASEIVEPLPIISTPSAQSSSGAAEVVEVPEAIETTPSGDDELGPRLPSGTALIQLAANTALADTQAQWKKIQAANTELLGSKSLYVEKTTVNGKLYYRLRVSGFADGAEAQAACVALLARNIQCLFVRAK